MKLGRQEGFREGMVNIVHIYLVIVLAYHRDQSEKGE